MAARDWQLVCRHELDYQTLNTFVTGRVTFDVVFVRIPGVRAPTWFPRGQKDVSVEFEPVSGKRAEGRLNVKGWANVDGDPKDDVDIAFIFGDEACTVTNHVGI